MISKGDDYPIHQTPEPIAYAGTDRNFYDRYFFNGYSPDGEVYFAVALGVYPHLNIMDAAFGVRIGDRQYNIKASRHLGMERMDTQVGPIRIEVIEPLKRLRITVDDNEHAIAADLTFEGRIPPFAEPRTTRRNGPRTLMDFTRMTQPGAYSGWIRAGDKTVAAGTELLGFRDRSWGIRAIGERDGQEQVPAPVAHFHWYWTPVQFPGFVYHFLVNENEDGAVWNRAALLAYDNGDLVHLDGGEIDITYRPGTRWPAKGVIEHQGRDGVFRIELTAGPDFFMTGIGYLDPEWSHGKNKGPLAVGYDEIVTSQITCYQAPHIYVQSFADATIALPNGETHHGFGTFEALSMGPNAKRGFTSFADGGPD